MSRGKRKRGTERKKGKHFFFEKKKQKTFAPVGRGSGAARVTSAMVSLARRATLPAASKSFLVLFFKKERLA
jgi:hypothetical protein